MGSGVFKQLGSKGESSGGRTLKKVMQIDIAAYSRHEPNGLRIHAGTVVPELRIRAALRPTHDTATARRRPRGTARPQMTPLWAADSSERAARWVAAVSQSGSQAAPPLQPRWAV